MFPWLPAACHVNAEYGLRPGRHRVPTPAMSFQGLPDLTLLASMSPGTQWKVIAARPRPCLSPLPGAQPSWFQGLCDVTCTLSALLSALLFVNAA